MSEAKKELNKLTIEDILKRKKSTTSFLQTY